jgi:hypothetical protein
MWNGILVVPVEINGAVTLDFAVDSGAAYVSVPAGVFSTLKHAGTIQEANLLGQEGFRTCTHKTRRATRLLFPRLCCKSPKTLCA